MTNEMMKMEDIKGNALAEVQNIFDVNDNIKGVTGRIPQLKIAHQAQMFIMPDDTKADKFTGIILHHSPANAWWATEFEQSGGGDLPDCFSLDAVHPQVTGEGKVIQSQTCAACKWNQFGSDGRGKACKNMWRLHILKPGEVLPKRITLPPSNLNQIQDYLISLRDKNLPHELVITEFGLMKTKSKDGIEFSKITFKPIGVVNKKDQALELKKIKEQFKAAFGEVIDVAEYGNSTAEPVAKTTEKTAPKTGPKY